MQKVYKPEGVKVPIKLWSDSFEEGALQQIQNAASLPFAYRHVALMPDGHMGNGAPIGGVLATKNVIVPNFVGVDIGCGMIARKLNIKKEVLTAEVLKSILGQARKAIPVGFAKRPDPINWEWSKLVTYENLAQSPIICLQEYKNSTYQIGTLGGGNHFIEIQADEDDNVWLMIHSGSRNLGKKICDFYNEKAQKLNERYFSKVNSDWKLSFLPIDTDEGIAYWNEMQIALQFAAINRHSMMETLTEIVLSEVDEDEHTGVTTEINAHHNYCALENHFGKNVYVHRKGAIRVREGELGIIPGSMGTPSYIVKGLGNPESFMSASHGAGRKMSRSEFNKTHTVEDANKAIEGVVFGRWGIDRKGNPDISECPLAYKDIQTVMDNQSDLVKPIVKLYPLASMKG